MYHDQVLMFKIIFKFDAINITLGLKYLRASPDHGTAVSLIGKIKLIQLNSMCKIFNNFLNGLQKLGQNSFIDKNIIKR